MKTKILSIADFVKNESTKTNLTVEQLRAQLKEAEAVWPFGWY